MYLLFELIFLHRGRFEKIHRRKNKWLIFGVNNNQRIRIIVPETTNLFVGTMILLRNITHLPIVIIKYFNLVKFSIFLYFCIPGSGTFHVH